MFLFQEFSLALIFLLTLDKAGAGEGKGGIEGLCKRAMSGTFSGQLTSLTWGDASTLDLCFNFTCFSIEKSRLSWAKADVTVERTWTMDEGRIGRSRLPNPRDSPLKGIYFLNLVDRRGVDRRLVLLMQETGLWFESEGWYDDAVSSFALITDQGTALQGDVPYMFGIGK